MATLAQLKAVKIESELPANSNEVVTDVIGTIRSIQTKEMDGAVKLFINLETQDGTAFLDTITFKDGNMDSTLRYLGRHASYITKQVGANKFAETFDDILAQLEKVRSGAKAFKFSTVRSTYNPEYIDVLYGDEQPQAA